MILVTGKPPDKCSNPKRLSRAGKTVDHVISDMFQVAPPSLTHPSTVCRAADEPDGRDGESGINEKVIDHKPEIRCIV
jgi:hypothetical protein